MPLSFEPERAPSGLCKYYLYQYTHVLLSCCTLVRPIGMSAKPEQSSALNLSMLWFGLRCHYSLLCPLACVNSVYINILMLSFCVAPWCAQLACQQNLSSRMLLSFEPECAPSGLCKHCLYQYTHVSLSCCTLVCPIGMWAKPEQSNAPQL